MAFRRRAFLNPISAGAPSFVQAVADSSDDGTYLLGNYILIIADCERRILLEFALTNKYQRKRSLAKIDRLAQLINDFREAIHAEAQLIDKRG